MFLYFFAIRNNIWEANSWTAKYLQFVNTNEKTQRLGVSPMYTGHIQTKNPQMLIFKWIFCLRKMHINYTDRKHFGQQS